MKTPSTKLTLLPPPVCACGCGETPKTPGATWCAGHKRGRRNKTGFVWIEGLHYEVKDSGCWEWLMGTVSGYGWNGGMAHRRGYESLYGKLPRNLECHHVCRNRLCVNPDHLEVINASEHRRQHKHGDSHLTPADIVAMREAAWAGETYEDIAPRYGIHAVQVGRICAGKQWKNVGGPIGDPPLRCRHCNAELDVKLRTKRYCNTTCQSAWHREQERQKAEHQCEKCHRGATRFYKGHYFCGHHAKRHENDPALVHLGSIYAHGRTREAARRNAA